MNNAMDPNAVPGRWLSTDGSGSMNTGNDEMPDAMYYAEMNRLTAERDGLRAREEAHMRVVVAAGRVRDEALAERDAARASVAALVEALDGLLCAAHRENPDRVHSCGMIGCRVAREALATHGAAGQALLAELEALRRVRDAAVGHPRCSSGPECKLCAALAAPEARQEGEG